MSELKPCPFCDSSLEVRGKNFAHPHGKCILSGHHFKGGFIGQWNKRVPDATISAEVERLRNIASDLQSLCDKQALALGAQRAQVQEPVAMRFKVPAAGFADPEGKGWSYMHSAWMPGGMRPHGAQPLYTRSEPQPAVRVTDNTPDVPLHIGSTTQPYGGNPGTSAVVERLQKERDATIGAAANGTGPEAQPFTFTYRNYRGETSVRRVIPLYPRFGSNQWHTEPQWLLHAIDLDKGEEREFAMKDMAPATRDEQ